MCPSRPPRLPGNRQLTNDRFFDILCCIFDEHLVKPRFTIDSRPNLNLNKALRIEPIRPRLGSFVHFSGFSSPLRRPVLPSPVIFFAPLPAAHNSEFTTYNPEVRAPRATAPLPIRSAKPATQLHKSFQIQQIPSRLGRSEPQAQNHKTQNASAVLSSRSPWREPPVVLETTPTFPALILLRLGPNSPPSLPWLPFVQALMPPPDLPSTPDVPRATSAAPFCPPRFRVSVSIDVIPGSLSDHSIAMGFNPPHAPRSPAPFRPPYSPTKSPQIRQQSGRIGGSLE